MRLIEREAHVIHPGSAQLSVRYCSLKTNQCVLNERTNGIVIEPTMKTIKLIHSDSTLTIVYNSTHNQWFIIQRWTRNIYWKYCLFWYRNKEILDYFSK